MGLDVGDVPTGSGVLGDLVDGAAAGLGCVMANKTAVVGNGLAGGSVKNHPLNVFQLSKHWCLSFPHCVWGEAGANSTTTAWGAALTGLCLLFAASLLAVVYPGLRAVKKHQKPPFSTILKNFH